MLGLFTPIRPTCPRHSVRNRVLLTAGPNSQETGSRASLVQVLTLRSLGCFPDLVWLDLELAVGRARFLGPP